MLEAILTAPEPFPAYLHRHILQLYVIKHRRPPATEAERRRAVFEYLTRTQKDKTGATRIHLSPEFGAWLEGEDEQVRGWGPVPRLAGIVYQFGGDLRKRYDLGVERDYKEYLCYLALSVRGALRWPDALIGEAMTNVLWESAPGIAQCSKVGLTRALNYIRRNAAPTRGLDLGTIADFSKLLMLVLSDLEQGKLPAFVLSPAQYDYLSQPVALKQSKLRLTGLTHHLLVERGAVQEKNLARPDVAEAARHEIARVLSRLRLPERVRGGNGAHLDGVTPIAARASEAAPVQTITVVGPLGHGSGLGAAARACVEAFKTTDIAVEVLNLVADWGRNDENAGSGLVSRVRGDINVIHFNPDVIIENLSRFGLEQFDGRYNIGFFFWETSKACLAHRLGADLVDEVWVSTEYCRKLFQEVTDKPVIVVGTPVPRIDDLSWATRSYFGLPDGKFTFVYTFDGASRFTRKNPLATVRAFQQAFPDDDGVRLVIKTQNTQWLTAADEKIYAALRRHSRADRRIIVIDESFSSNEVHGLISVCDCYVALHRSEGFGYGMAEAMKLRVPVIATGDSGNADFTTEATSYPVRFHRIPVAPRDFVYQEDGQEWAEPDVDHAAMRMLEVRTDPNRAAKIQAAYEFIEANCNEVAVGRTYRERITAIRAGLAAGTDVQRLGAAA